MKNKVIDLLNKSGHNLHLRTYEKVKESKVAFSKIIVSGYYIDKIKNVPRELDLLSQRKIKSSNKTFNVLIECKYIKHLTFYEQLLSPKDLQIVIAKALQADRLVELFELERELNSTRLVDLHKRSKIGVVCEPYKIAFDAVDTLLKSQSYFRSNQFVNYLVVVVNDNCGMYRITRNSIQETNSSFSDNDLEEIDQQLMQVNYTDGQGVGEKMYIVNVIKEKKLPELLEELYFESYKLF